MTTVDGTPPIASGHEVAQEPAQVPASEAAGCPHARAASGAHPEHLRGLEGPGVPSSELFSPSFSRDPNPTYAWLRDEKPVCPVTSPRFDSFFISRYEDAKTALADPRLSKDLYGPEEKYRLIFGPNSALLNQNMLHSDPPEHTRMRRLVSQAFTPRRVDALAPRVQELVDDLVDTIAPRGETEFVHDFGLPLPITVICELLGVPASDRDSFVDHTETIRTRGTAGRGSEEDRQAVQDAQQALADYLVDLIARKRAQPADDLLTDLIAARDGEGRLSERELVSTAFLLLFAGHQTTSDFLGNAVVALLTHPDQLAVLRERPEVLPGAVEELLRFDGSVPVASPRFTTEDVEYHGVTMPKGSIVTVVLNAADRDPARFERADELDVTRPHNPHVAFGHGIHFCLGVSLARLEARIALGTLFARLPDLALAVPPEELRRPPASSPFRGLIELPLVFSPA